MSRITKEIAENVTKELLSKKVEKKSELLKEIGAITRQELILSIPMKVMELFSQPEEKRFFQTESSVYLMDFSRLRVSFSPIPKSDGNYYYKFTNEETRKKVGVLYKKYIALEKQINQLEDEIKHSLLSLKTFKRIEEQFPEAFKFLPKDNGAFLPALNIRKIQDSLKD
jgi:hypothetical protein